MAKGVGDVDEESDGEEEETYEVGSILGCRVKDGYNEYMYLVRWAGYNQSHDTWQKEGALEGSRDIIQQFQETKAAEEAQKVHTCTDYMHILIPFVQAEDNNQFLQARKANMRANRQVIDALGIGMQQSAVPAARQPPSASAPTGAASRRSTRSVLPSEETTSFEVGDEVRAVYCGGSGGVQRYNATIHAIHTDLHSRLMTVTHRLRNSTTLYLILYINERRGGGSKMNDTTLPDCVGKKRPRAK